MVIFVIGLVAVFVILPWLIGKTLWDTIGLRLGFLAKLTVVGVIAWALWTHFQLRPEDTGTGYILGHPERFGGQASQSPAVPPDQMVR